MISKSQSLPQSAKLASTHDARNSSSKPEIVHSSSSSCLLLSSKGTDLIGSTDIAKVNTKSELYEQSVNSELNRQFESVALTQVSDPVSSELNNSFSDQVDQLLLSKSRRPVETIKANIDKVYTLTEKVDQSDGDDVSYTFYTEDGRLGGSDGHLDIQTSHKNNIFMIESSLRLNYKKATASDVYIAQLAHLGSSEEVHLPQSLPQTIIRGPITNKYTQEVMNQILDNTPKDEDGSVNLILDRNNPDAPSNEIIHFLLTETVNGKSTAYMINDFNNLTDSKQTIESAVIKTDPHRIEFNIGTLDNKKI